jgi:hypothetical protein
MSRTKVALTGAALAVDLGVTVAGPATARDGRLYAFEHRDLGGDFCYWTGNHADWRYSEWNMPNRGECSWFGSSLNSNFNDQASSLVNNGYPGGLDDVRLYRDINYRGPSICLRNGDGFGDLSLGRERFSDGTIANDRISSHKWVRSC